MAENIDMDDRSIRKRNNLSISAIEVLPERPNTASTTPVKSYATSRPFFKFSKRTKFAFIGVGLISIVVALIVSLSVCFATEGKCGLAKGNGADPQATGAAQGWLGGPTADNQTTPQNLLLLQGFEWYMLKDSLHWVRMSNQLGKLQAIGVENIWIPPPTKAATYSIGYDAYDLWDLGEFDQKGQIPTAMGTKSQLESLVSAATTLGMRVTLDAVMNQRNGADQTVECDAIVVNNTDRLQDVGSPLSIEAWVGFTFPGRDGVYSNKTWSCDDFTATSLDERTQKYAIYKLEGEDNAFATDVSHENGNYDYLMLQDVAYRNDAVQNDILNWGWWITAELGLGGMRFDGAKHLSQSFQLDFIENIRQHSQDGQDLFYLAEYVDGLATTIKPYADAMQSRVHIFDVPLQANLAQFAAGNLTDLRAVYNNSYVEMDPTLAVTYVMSHDTQIGQSLANENISGWFLPLAYALTLLRQGGYPDIFYGDIYGMYDENNNFHPPPYAEVIGDMAYARKYYAYGNQTDYFEDDESVVGWTRPGTNDRKDGMAVLVSIKEDGTTQKEMNVGEAHAGEVWTAVVGDSKTRVTIDSQGNGIFDVSARNVSVFANEDAENRKDFGGWDPTIYGG